MNDRDVARATELTMEPRECTDVAVEEIVDDYTQPAVTTRGLT